jgi:hypothetical protein
MSTGPTSGPSTRPEEHGTGASVGIGPEDTAGQPEPTRCPTEYVTNAAIPEMSSCRLADHSHERPVK